MSPALKWLLGTASLIVIIAGLRAASLVLIPFVVAVFLALISFPVVQWFERRGVPPALAVVVTMTGVFLALIGPGLLVAAAALQFATAAPAYEARLRQILAAASEWLRLGDLDMTWVAGLIDPAQIFNLLVTTLMGLVTLLSAWLLVVFIAGFMLFEVAAYLERRYQLMAASPAVARIIRDLQTYLWVKTLVSALTGVAAGAWVAVLGVDFPILWGLVAFLLNYVPNLGSLVAALPPALLALIQFGPFETALVLLGYLVLNTAFGYFVEPYLMGRQLSLSTFVVLVSVFIWGWIWGVAGMLLSVPLTMAMTLTLEYSEEWRWLADFLRGGRAAPAAAGRAGLFRRRGYTRV